MKLKKVQIPFSIDAWKKGARVETRDGRQVRIVCADAKLNNCDIPQPIFGLITENDEEHTETWAIVGSCFQNNYTFKDDLVIVEEIDEPERWADVKEAKGRGWFIDLDSEVEEMLDCKINHKNNFAVFANEKLARSARAAARISQLMIHDERYGGVVTDAEWRNTGITKFIIGRDWCRGIYTTSYIYGLYTFLAFHTAEQRDLFLAENKQLIKDYLMLQ